MISLSDLTILAIDCQATGANPTKGRLLEIGWLASYAGRGWDDQQPLACAHLLRYPDDTVIPKAVQRITGITADDLKTASALPEAEIWRRLVQAADGVSRRNHGRDGSDNRCPTVIHYAGFETPFLKALHQTHGAGRPFPFRIICTHAIAIRLLPSLPRRGLRALAGFLGHGLPEKRRCADHVLATHHIWKRLTAQLASEHQIDTLDALERWLAAAGPPAKTPRAYPMNPRWRQHLPESPGVYHMRRIDGELLYIGKAISLKQRINSYFRPNAAHAEHILEMLSQAGRVDIAPTPSALEAAVLEAEQIQRWQPAYNRALRDGGRGVCFFSRDFREFSLQPDARHDLGPFPENSLCRTLPAFGGWLAQVLKSNCTGEQNARWLAMMLPELPPDATCGQAGLDLFLERWQPWLIDRPVVQALHLLGVRFWQENKQALNAGKQPSNDGLIDDLDSDPGAPAGERQWTPDLICSALQSRLRHWAHLLRRSRWLCILSQSSLAWRSIDKPQSEKQVVMIKNGAIANRWTLPLAAPLPVPPGFAISTALRRQAMDRAAYDRLRVLTTELRRLMAQDRVLELRIGPRACLSNLSLSRLMHWI